MGAGVIDADYRGEVKVLLFNHGDVDFAINEGDRIAQLIIEKYTPTQLVEVETLSETTRGEGGFGSTGTGAQMENSKKRDQSAQEATHAAENTAAEEASFFGSSSDRLLMRGDKTRGGEATTVGAIDKSAKLIMIYLSMHDCPGCLEFTPLLDVLY